VDSSAVDKKDELVPTATRYCHGYASLAGKVPWIPHPVGVGNGAQPLLTVDKIV
jgi:hypothetical protein